MVDLAQHKPEEEAGRRGEPGCEKLILSTWKKSNRQSI